MVSAQILSVILFHKLSWSDNVNNDSSSHVWLYTYMWLLSPKSDMQRRLQTGQILLVLRERTTAVWQRQQLCRCKRSFSNFAHSQNTNTSYTTAWTGGIHGSGSVESIFLDCRASF